MVRIFLTAQLKKRLPKPVAENVNQENISQPGGALFSGLLPGKANWKNFGFSLAAFSLVVIIWYAVAMVVTLWRGVPFPTPWATAHRLLQALGGATLVNHSIYRHTADSLLRWGDGFLVAACCGIAFGLAAGWWRISKKSPYRLCISFSSSPDWPGYRWPFSCSRG